MRPDITAHSAAGRASYSSPTAARAVPPSQQHVVRGNFEGTSVATDQDKAREIISRFLRQADKGRDSLTDDLGLYGEGLELDSLEIAELSAVLEDEFGSDPFSADGDMPETIGAVLAFYAPASA